MDDSTDRFLETLTRISVDLEGLRVTLVSLLESKGDHERRLREVEHWKERMSPYVNGLAFLLGAVASAVVQWFS